MIKKTIGPTFERELKAAGLIGLAFAWGSDGNISFDASLNAQQVAAIKAVYSAHDPGKADNSLEAFALLDKTDIVMHRVSEAVSLGLSSWTAADVVAWVNYRRALRTIVSGAISNSIPSVPAFPQGT
jgi:hypothetical protein